MDALVRASREAMLNAAKHSGADRVDVYAEILEDVAEVYVRDRGQGFEAGAVSDDRMGIRGSIVDRMARHDGTARVRSAPGEGTEVWLRMELE
jgi:signal transduction histidine kinase